MKPQDSKTDGGDAGKLTFEQSLEQLEVIVQQLEDGDLDMDAALAAYEKGLSRLKRCYHLLDTAEQKVQQLAGLDKDGNPLTEPFSEPQR